MNTLQQIVGAVATAIATILLAMGQGMSKKGGVSVVRFTNGAHYGFYFTLILIVIGFLLSLTIKEDGNN